MTACQRAIMLTGAVAVCVLLAACARQPLVPDSHLPQRVRPQTPRPSYNQIAGAHNARVEGLERLWTRTQVKVRWREDGKRRQEKGEGKLIMAPVSDDAGRTGIAITLGKIGQTIFWAGTDGERFWLFDLRGDKQVTIGSHTPGDTASVPLLQGIGPIDAVPALLGLAPVPLLAEDRPAETVAGHYVLRPRPGVSMLVNPRTLRPVRVMLADERGREDGVVAHLDAYEPADIAALSAAEQPLVPTRVDLYNADPPTHVALRLWGMTDQRINPGIFDLDTLLEAHRPADVVLLDQARPAR